MPTEHSMEPKVHTNNSTIDIDQGSDSEDESVMDGKQALLEKQMVMDDLEAQRTIKRADDPAAEYQVPTNTKYLFLGVYFTLNLALTIYNKYVLGKVRPEELTHAHTARLTC